MYTKFIIVRNPPGLQFHGVVHLDRSDPVGSIRKFRIYTADLLFDQCEHKKTGSFNLSTLPVGGTRLFINLKVGSDCKVKLFDKYLFEYTDIILLIKHQHRFFIVDRVNGPE